MEKDIGDLVDERQYMSQQYVLTARKGNCILGCIQRSVASRMRKVSLPLCSCEIPTWSAASSSGGPSTRKTLVLLEQVQRRAAEMIRELENLSYEGSQSWDCSAYRREGFRETLEHLPVPKKGGLPES